MGEIHLDWSGKKRNTSITIGGEKVITSNKILSITHHTPLPRSTGLHLLFMFSGCLSPGTPHSKHTQVKNFRGWGQGQCYLHLAQQQLALSSEHGWDLIDLLIDCWYWIVFCRDALLTGFGEKMGQGGWLIILSGKPDCSLPTVSFSLLSLPFLFG